MKRLIFPVLLLFSLYIYADETTSLQSEYTFGLFKNALDAAFEVNENGTTPNFSSLTHPYIFGGLTNFSLQETSTESTDGTDIPFILGFYLPGQTPTSYKLEMEVNTASDEGIESGVISQVTSSVVDTAEADLTSTYDWISEETSQLFNVNEALSLDSAFQFIIHSGAVNLGAEVTFDYDSGDLDDPLSWAENNRKIETLYNYDLMAGTPPPQAALDYSVTEIFSQKDTAMRVGLTVPFYFKAGNTGHMIEAGVLYERIDNSSSYSRLYSDPASAGPSGSFSDETDSGTDLLHGIELSSRYTLTLAPIIPTHQGNYFELSPWFNYRINIAGDLEESVLTETYSINALEKELSSRSLTEVFTERTLSDSFDTGLSIRHPLYFGLSAVAALGIGPELILGYTQTPLVDPDDNDYSRYLVAGSETTTEKTDSDGDGTYEQTIVTTITRNSDGEGLARKASFRFALPMVLRLTPEGWPFEFTLASRIEAGTDLTWTVDGLDSSDTTVETLDSTGTVIDTEKTVQTGSTDSTNNRFWSDWEFTNSNRLGLTFRFPKYVTLDVILNSSNLFNFDELTIQTIIALP